MKIQSEAFRKVQAQTASEIASRVELSQEAQRFMIPGLTPQGLISVLWEAGLKADAIRFLAFAIPVREAVWWACVCTEALFASKSNADRICLNGTAQWVFGQDDTLRRQCMALAEAAGLSGPAAFAAMAAFWSGGSIAPSSLPDVLPDERLAPIGAGASVLLAITSGDPLGLDKRFDSALERGMGIANGGNGWLPGDRPNNFQGE